MNVNNKHTEIQFKRTSENSTFIEDGGVIKKGEPFYDSNNQHLYIGNQESDVLKEKKHLTQITEEATDYDNTPIFTFAEFVGGYPYFHTDSYTGTNILELGYIYLRFSPDTWSMLQEESRDYKKQAGNSDKSIEYNKFWICHNLVGNGALQFSFVSGKSIVVDDITPEYMLKVSVSFLEGEGYTATDLIEEYSDDTVDFSIGENLTNRYTKKIDHIDNSKNLTTSIRNVPLEDFFEYEEDVQTTARTARKLIAEPYIDGVKFDGTSSIRTPRYHVSDVSEYTPGSLTLTLQKDDGSNPTVSEGALISVHLDRSTYDEIIDLGLDENTEVRLDVASTGSPVYYTRHVTGANAVPMYVKDLWFGHYLFKHVAYWMCIDEPTKNTYNAYTAENLNASSEFKFDALNDNVLKLTIGDKSIEKKLDIQDYNENKGSIKDKFVAIDQDILDIIDGDTTVGRAQETVHTPYISGFPASNNSSKFATPMYYTAWVQGPVATLQLLKNTTLGDGVVNSKFWEPEVGFRFWWYNTEQFGSVGNLQIQFQFGSAYKKYTCYEITASGTGENTSTIHTNISAKSLEIGWYEFEIISYNGTTCCRWISSPKSDEWATF